MKLIETLIVLAGVFFLGFLLRPVLMPCGEEAQAGKQEESQEPKGQRTKSQQMLLDAQDQLKELAERKVTLERETARLESAYGYTRKHLPEDSVECREIVRQVRLKRSEMEKLVQEEKRQRARERRLRELVHRAEDVAGYPRFIISDERWEGGPDKYMNFHRQGGSR